MKKCRRCHILKNNSEFNKDKSQRDGLQPCCKCCKHEMFELYYPKTREQRMIDMDKYNKEHKMQLRIQARRYAKFNECPCCR